MVKKYFFVMLFFITIVSNTAWGFEIFPITTNQYIQSSPEIYENVVVWTDGRNNGEDIYGYNLLTSAEFQITNYSTTTQSLPVIYGDTVVWQDHRNGNWDIYGYNSLTDEEFQITSNEYNQERPAIYGDIVVWSDNRNGYYPNHDIYGYNLLTSAEFVVSSRLPNNNQKEPDIYGDIVVWSDGKPSSIRGANLSSGEEFEVSNDVDANPAIYGHMVVGRNDHNIYCKNLITGELLQITTNSTAYSAPEIHGNIVVWSDWRSGNPDIYGYNLLTGEEFQITNDEYDQLSPQIYGDIIVWQDYRNGNGDIYGTTVPEPNSIILLGIGLSGVFGFMKQFKK